MWSAPSLSGGAAADGGQSKEDSPEGQARVTEGPPAGCQVWRNRVKARSCGVRQAEREKKEIPGRGNSLCENRRAEVCGLAQRGCTVRLEKCEGPGLRLLL